MIDKSPQTPTLPVTQVISRPDQPEVLQVRRALLEVVEGPDRGARQEIGEAGGVVGSGEECDLTLSDDTVSRRHLEVRPGTTGFVLRDLGSKNGTRAGGLEVREVVLGVEHDIEVGACKLRFSLLDDRDEYPLSSKTAFGELLGRSLAMRRVFALLERASGSDTTVLLEGESGTGKDLAAESVHQSSPRRDGPFTVVDCGAIQSSLVEGELFGHTKGAFTGAERDRAGVFEGADGGTVFLDEVGELDPALQPRLLRLLERREIRRLGENSYRSVNVRVVAATNRDIEAEVEAGRFREDLYYRLSVVRVRLPGLRERREDIGMLARAFVQRLRPELDPLEVISDQTLGLLLNHDWPGNVRELRNVVERLLLFPDYPRSAISPRTASTSEDTGELLTRPFHEARRVFNDRFERTYVSALLDANRGVVSDAAKAAGISRQTFHRLVSKHQLVK